MFSVLGGETVRGLDGSPQLEEVGAMFLSRRQFLKVSVGTVAAVAVADQVLALTALQPVIEVGNPLGDYPDRSWERVYHDQYRYDSSFTWVCSQTIRMPVASGPLSATAW